tara:strand:- start:174 stop:341 length:168 start_codon:yes stop_codon:yes gene_type:complete
VLAIRVHDRLKVKLVAGKRKILEDVLRNLLVKKNVGPELDLLLFLQMGSKHWFWN